MDCSQREIDIEELLRKKQQVFPDLISSLAGECEISQLVENIQSALIFLPVLYISDIEEEFFKHVFPVMVQTLQQVYRENNEKAIDDQQDILNLIRNNLKVALIIIEISTRIVEFLIKFETMQLSQVQSLSFNIVRILLYTFEHCKSSQKSYHSSLKTVNEIVELFRKTQDLHSKYLLLLDSNIAFDSENEVNILKDLLINIYEMSKTLSGVNMKCMADSWKSFTKLIQDHPQVLTLLNLKPQFKSLSDQIKQHLEDILSACAADLKKATQKIKLAGFLIKVALKLLTVCDNIVDNYFEDVLEFYLVIYSYPCTYFKTYKFPDEFIAIIEDVLFVTTQNLLDQLISEGLFLNKIHALNEKHNLVTKNSFGFLVFSNEILKKLPELIRDEASSLSEFEMDLFLTLIFSVTKFCYKEFFWDSNSAFYEDFAVNIAVSVLIYPHDYQKIEEIFLTSVCQERIWTSLLAIDSWILVLRNCSSTTSVSLFKNLICKFSEFKLGKFVQIPQTYFLKILIRRVFKILPSSVSNEFISKYSPKNNIAMWKILDLNLIPLSQRFQVDSVLSDLYDKIGCIEKQNSSIDDVVEVLELLEVLSSVDFANLQISVSRLAPFVVRLWSFNVTSEIAINNNFYKYFISRLTKITKAITGELVTENLLQILNQLRHSLNEPLFKLHLCEILPAICKRNIGNGNHNKDKQIFCGLLIQILQNFLSDNPVIIKASLQVLHQISCNDNYKIVVNKLTNSSPIDKLLKNYTQNLEVDDLKIHFDYLESLKVLKFRHRCLEWSESDQPQSKRIKLEDDLDKLVSEIKYNTKKLVQAKYKLDQQQLKDLKNVVSKLETLFY